MHLLLVALISLHLRVYTPSHLHSRPLCSGFNPSYLNPNSVELNVESGKHIWKNRVHNWKEKLQLMNVGSSYRRIVWILDGKE
jgi:hypothetical protein